MPNTTEHTAKIQPVLLTAPKELKYGTSFSRVLTALMWVGGRGYVKTHFVKGADRALDPSELIELSSSPKQLSILINEPLRPSKRAEIMAAQAEVSMYDAYDAYLLREEQLSERVQVSCEDCQDTGYEYAVITPLCKGCLSCGRGPEDFEQVRPDFDTSQPQYRQQLDAAFERNKAKVIELNPDRAA